MRARAVPLLVVIVLLTAAACTGGRPGGDATAPAADPGEVSTAPTARGDGPTGDPSPTAPADGLFAFQAPQVTGGTYDASVLSGRDVAVWFWAPW